MKLMELYRSILSAAWLEADKEGFISDVSEPSLKAPFLVGEKRLVLPMDNQLAADKSKITLFHPLFEYITRTESDVTVAYRRQLSETMGLRFFGLMSELLVLAGSQKKHAKLSPEQSEFLALVPDADEAMYKAWKQLGEAMPVGQNQRVFCSIYLKRGGVIDGKAHQRVAVTSFPLYEALIEDGKRREEEMESRRKHKKADEKQATLPNETYGVHLRAKDRESFIKLIEYMVPNIMVEHAYSVPSDSNIAPTIAAIMGAAERLGGAVNMLVDRFLPVIGESLESFRMEDNWVPDFMNLAPLQAQIRMIPMQEGNEGGTVKTEALAAEATGHQGPVTKAEAAPSAPATTQAPAAQQAVPAAAPVQEETTERKLPAGFKLPSAPSHPQQPQGYQPGGYPQQQPYPQAQPQYPQQGYPQQQPQYPYPPQPQYPGPGYGYPQQPPPGYGYPPPNPDPYGIYQQPQQPQYPYPPPQQPPQGYPQQGHPQQPPGPAPTDSHGRVSFRDAMARSPALQTTAYTQQMQQYQAQQPYGYGAPQQPVTAENWGQQQQGYQPGYQRRF